MGVTVLPSSMPSRRGAPPPRRRVLAPGARLDTACTIVGSSSSSSAAAIKKPKRAGSCRSDEPAMKRGRVGGDAEAKATMSLEEKNGVNDRLLLSSLLPSGRTPDEVILLPDPVVRVLQGNGARNRSCCGRDETHGDGACRVIKDRVAEYLEDRAQRLEAPPSQSKEGGVIGQSRARSFPPKVASTRIPSKTIPPRAVPLPPTPPKPSESVRELDKNAISISQRLPRNMQAKASPSLPVPPESLGSKRSMKELLEDASRVMKEVARRREIERIRAAARLEVEQMVRTVEFNDPYIDPQDVFK